MSFSYAVKNEVVKLELFNIMRPNGDVLDPNYFNIQIKGNTASWDKGHFVATRALVPFNEAETIGQPYPVEDGSITVTLPLPNSNKVFTQMVIVEGYNPTFTTESGC